MPLTYNDVLTKWDRSRAFGDPRDFKSFANDLEELHPQEGYAQAAHMDGWWTRASHRADQYVFDPIASVTTEPLMGAIGGLFGHEAEGREVGRGLPRMAAEIAPLFIPGVGELYGAAATGGLIGAHTYADTGSGKAAVISGLAGAAMPYAGKAGAALAGESAIGRYLGTQAGVLATNAGSSVWQQKVMNPGEPFDWDKFAVNTALSQIPFTAMDAVAAVHGKYSTSKRPSVAPLEGPIKPPTFSPAEDTVEKQAQVAQMFARFDAAQKAGATPEALSEMLVSVVNTIGKEPEKPVVPTTVAPVDPEIHLSGRAEKQGKNWKMEVADQTSEVPFALPEHKNVWINSVNDPKLDATSGLHIWSGKHSELNDQVKVPLPQPKPVDTAQQELTSAINPQGTEPQFVAPEHVEDVAEANAVAERASAREQKATANANNDLTVAENLPAIVPPDVAKPAIEKEITEHKATPEQAVQSVVLQAHTPVVEEAQMTQKAAKATVEALLTKARAGKKLTKAEVNRLAAEGEHPVHAEDEQGRPSLSWGAQLESSPRFKSEGEALEWLANYRKETPSDDAEWEVQNRGEKERKKGQFVIAQRAGKTKPLFEETQKEGITTQGEMVEAALVDDPLTVKPNELPSESKNIAGRTILEAAMKNVAEFGRGAGLSDPLETAKLLSRTKILMATGAADRETLNAALVKANVKPFTTDEEYKQFLLRAARGLNKFRSLYSDPSLGHIEPRDETLFREMQVEQRGARGMIEWLGRQDRKLVPQEWHPLITLGQDLLRALSEVDDPLTTYPGHAEWDGYLGYSFHWEEQLRPTITLGHMPTDHMDALITALKATHEMAHHATRELTMRSDPAALKFKDMLETVRQALLKASPKAVQKIVNESLRQGLYEKYSAGKKPALSAGDGWIWGVGDYDSATNRLNNKVTLAKDGTLALKVFQDRGGVGGRPLTKDEVDMQRSLVPEAFDDKGNVNVPMLFRELAKRQPVVTTHTYGQEGKPSEAKAELDRMTHEWYDSGATPKILEDALFGNLRQRVTEDFLLKEGYKQEDIDKAKQYQVLRERVSSEPLDTSPRATSYYNQISPYDTKEFPVVRVDVAVPEVKATAQERQRYEDLFSRRRQEVQSGKQDLLTPQEREEYDALSSKVSAQQLWPPDNLHENLPNTLGWAMVQFVPDPKTGETVAFVGEQQSRWGQERQSKEKEYKRWPVREALMENEIGHRIHATGGPAVEEYLQRGYKVVEDKTVEHDKYDASSHPLLPLQHSLVLKAVIAEAAKRGVTKVVLSGGETAMMTGGHDKAARTGIHDEFNIPYPTREEAVRAGEREAEQFKESEPSVIAIPSFKNLPSLSSDQQKVTTALSREGVVLWAPSKGRIAYLTEGNSVKEVQKSSLERLVNLGVLETTAEGPDTNWHLSTDWTYQIKFNKPQISQSGGMRLHYDTTLPSAMKKLTGKEGEAWDGGVHKNAGSQEFTREDQRQYQELRDLGMSDEGATLAIQKNKRFGSPVFRNADGTPKFSVTGRAYDITEAVAKMNAQGGAFTLTGKAMSTPFNIRSEWAKIGGTTGDATVREHSDLIYALHNGDELLGQIFNAPDVVQRLADLQMPRTVKRSLLQVFTDAWRKLFGGAKTSGSALAQLLHGFGNYLSTGKDVAFDAEAFMRDVLLAKGVKPEALASRINTIRNVFTTGKIDASVRGFDNEGKRGMLPPTLQAKYPERAFMPTVKSPDGKTFESPLGHDMAYVEAEENGYTTGKDDGFVEGYKTNKQRFVPRDIAGELNGGSKFRDATGKGQLDSSELARTPSAVHPALLTDLLTGAPRDVYTSTINLLADELPLHQELLHRMAEDVYIAQRIRQEIKAGRAPGKLPDNEASLRLASANINAMRRAFDKQMLALDRFNSLNQFTEEGWRESTLAGATGKRLPALPADRTGHEQEGRDVMGLGAEYRGDEVGVIKRYFWPTQFLKQQILIARDAFNHIDDAQSQQNVRRNELNLQLGWNNATGEYDRGLADNYVRVRSTEGLQKVGSNVLRRAQELEAQNKPWMQDAVVQSQLSRLSPNDRRAVTDAINSLRNRKADWNQRIAPESLTKDNLYHTAQVFMLREGTLDKGQAIQLSTDLYNALRDLRDPQTAVQGTQGLAVLRDRVSPDTFMAVLTHANTRINNSDKWLQFMQSRPTWVTEQRKKPHLLQIVDTDGKPAAFDFDTRDAAIAKQRELLARGYTNPRYTERPTAEVRGTIEESVLQSMREMDIRNETAMQQAFADRPELVPQIQPFINRVDEYQNALAAGNPVPGPRVAKRAFRGGREELNMFEQDDRFFQGANNYLKSKLMDGVVGLDLLDPQLRGNAQATALVRQHLSNVKGFDNPWVRKLNEFTYFKNLGWNFGVNFLHAIQSLTTGMTAVIEETGSVGDAMKLTTKATKEVVQRYTTGKWSNPDLEYVAGRLQAQGGAGILAHDDFIDHDRDSMMLLNSQNPVGKVVDKIQGAARNWTNMFARHNDMVGTIAGFMLGKERGMSNEDAFQLGWDMKQRGYYSAGKSGRAVMGWSAKTRAVPQLMWSLQNYTASWFAQLGNNWTKGFSTRELGMSPVQIAGARKAFFYQLAAQGVLAGALGLPGVGQGLALFKQVTGNDAKDWLKKNLAGMFNEDEVNGGFMTTLALHGGMAGATPIDVSAKHIPSFPFTGVSPRNGFSLENLIPAPLATASDVVKGLIAAAKGESITPALPHVLQQPFQLLANDGALKDQYGTYQLSPAEQFVTALGMKPSRVQETQDAAKLVADTQRNAAAQRAKEAQEIAELYRSGDGVGAQQKLAEWRSAHPTDDHAGFVRQVAGQVAQSTAPANTFDYTGNRIPNQVNRLQATTGAMSALGIPRLPNLRADMMAEQTDRLMRSNPYLTPSEARRDATSGTRPTRSPFGW